MKELQVSWRSRLGGTEGIAGEECERGLNPLSPGDLGASPRKFLKLGYFLLQSGHSSALFQGQSFSPLISRKIYISQINAQIRA